MSKRKYPTGMTNQGVLDLDSPGWKAHHRSRVVRETPPVPESAVESREIVDLIYDALSREDKEQILSLWPGAVFEAEYDFIHEWRTQVRLPKCSTMSWYRFLVRSGFASISLAFQLSMLEDHGLIEAVLDAERPGWRTRKHTESSGKDA